MVSKLGLTGVTLVVQDWGGVIGLGWAVRNKPLVKRLVILNTTGYQGELVLCLRRADGPSHGRPAATPGLAAARA